MPGDADDDDFAATYAAQSASLHVARGEFSAWLRGWPEADHVHDEMLVVLSELLANAISASTDGEGEVAVSGRVDDDSVCLEVTNPPASEFSLVDRWDYDDPLRPGGRGLLIVEALVDDLAIVPPDRHRSLSVRCRRLLVPLSTP